jgi:hypothetical protein
LAGTLISTDVSVLEGVTTGFIQLSIDEWDSSLEPEITAGSKIEIAGALIEFQALEDIDLAGAFGGIANSTLIYCLIDGVTYIPYITTTAPHWNDEAQGWYDIASDQDRCYMTIYKSSTGTYTQKTILLNRSQGITYQGITSVEDFTNGFADLRSYKAGAGAADVQIAQLVTAGAGAGSAFTIKKPIMALLITDDYALNNYGYLQIQSNSGWLNLGNNTGLANGGWTWVSHDSPGYEYYAGVLAPGTYRLYNDFATTTTLYVLGVYGDNAITAGNIVI